MAGMTDVKLTKPQAALLSEIIAAGEQGMVVPGTRGSTAKVLRAKALVEVVDGDSPPPNRQRATEAGRAWKATCGAQANPMPGAVVLRAWAVVPGNDDMFQAPEQAGIRLAGEVHGHPSFPDGKKVETSPIVSVAGRLITTRSGRSYRLDGDPDPKYLSWLQEHGHRYVPEAPIAVKQR
jgi:hypothetical protein